MLSTLSADPVRLVVCTWSCSRRSARPQSESILPYRCRDSIMPVSFQTISPLRNEKSWNRNFITLLAEKCPLYPVHWLRMCGRLRGFSVSVSQWRVFRKTSFIRACRPQMRSYPVLVQTFNVCDLMDSVRKLISQTTHRISFKYHAQPHSSIPGYGTVLANIMLMKRFLP